MKSFNKYDLFAEFEILFVMGGYGFFLRGSERAGRSNKFRRLCDEESG